MKFELISGAVCCFWSHSCCFMRRKVREGRLQCCYLCLTYCNNIRSLKLNPSTKAWPFHCQSICIVLKTGNGTRSQNLRKLTKKKKSFKNLSKRKHWGLGDKLLHQEGHSPKAHHLLFLKNWKLHETWFQATLVVRQKWRQTIKTESP